MNNKVKDESRDFSDKFKFPKKALYIIAIILLGLILLLFVCGDKDLLNIKNGETDSFETEYINSLTEKLKNTLNKVDGVGEVSVVITVKSGKETVLATKTTVTETTSGKETVETPIIINGKTVIIKENYPEITGVLIVAEGAENLAVRSRILQATSSLFDINPNQIEILAMK